MSGPVAAAEGPVAGQDAVAGAAALLELEHLEVEFRLRGRGRGGERGRGGRARAGGRLRAVADVSLAVGEGETVGLVGESGCGKTTLARAAVRLIEPTAGEVRFEGRAIGHAGRRELAPLRGALQMVFQDPLGSLNPRRRVGDSIAQPLRLAGAGRTAAAAQVRELLGRVGLAEEHAQRWPYELSGGQRQRVEIARALASSPRLLVLDEPVSALDVSVQAQIVNLLEDLQHELGLAYLFVAHDLSVVRHVAARVAVMYLGKLMEVGPTDRLYATPAHPYTAALLAAVPAPEPPAAGGPRRRAASSAAPPEPGGPSPGAPRLADEPPRAAARPTGCVFHPRCPRASDVCRTSEPPLTAYPDGRVAACHHPLGVSREQLAGSLRSPASPRSAGDAAPSAAV